MASRNEPRYYAGPFGKVGAKVIAILYRIAIVLCLATVSGCSAAAAPCRVTGAVVEVVPLVGGVLGAAFRACGDAID
ncbi:MAG: hypothetical protein O2985_08335 [Proteobacteria bacterium]|nr:hypothetical protein [Pseudomonadota bacterium]